MLQKSDIVSMVCYLLPRDSRHSSDLLIFSVHFFYGWRRPSRIHVSRSCSSHGSCPGSCPLKKWWYSPIGGAVSCLLAELGYLLFVERQVTFKLVVPCRLSLPDVSRQIRTPLKRGTCLSFCSFLLLIQWNLTSCGEDNDLNWRLKRQYGLGQEGSIVVWGANLY